jgi:phenylacetate-CoA ligase
MSRIRFRPVDASHAGIAAWQAASQSNFASVSRSQWLDPQQIEAVQLARLRALLLHCASHVPYYREQLRRLGCEPADIVTMESVRHLPVLDRAVFRARREEFAAEALPHCSRVVGQQSTSGTTGIPISVAVTNVSKAWWLSLYLRDLDWCGVDPSRNRATIRPFEKPNAPASRLSTGISLPFWNESLHRLLETGTAHRLDMQQTVAMQLDWLARVRPDYLLSYPSNLALLGAALEAEGRRLDGLRLVQSIGEQMTPAQGERIGRQLGAPVRNTYSCVEAGYLASPCPDGHGLHVHAESVILEVLDDGGQPCGPGEAGRVVLTPLHNDASPMIRYEIGDRVTLGPYRCPCGRGLPLLREVEGKMRPSMIRGDGTRRSSTDIAVYLQAPTASVAQYRCIQSVPGQLRLEIVPAVGWGEIEANALKAFLAGFIGPGGSAELAVVAEIARTPGGKHRDIVGLP